MVAELNRAELASGMAEKLKQHKERAKCAALISAKARVLFESFFLFP